jgi:hypothetical protein
MIIEIERPINPVLFRNCSMFVSIPAVIQNDPERGIIIYATLKDSHPIRQFPKLPPNQAFDLKALPIHGAIVYHERDFAFFDNTALAERDAERVRQVEQTMIRETARLQESRKSEAERQAKCLVFNTDLALPFTWHPGWKATHVSCYDGPKTNGSGATRATVDHIIVDESLAIGRLKREALAFLCGVGGSHNMCETHHHTLSEVRVSCKACLTIAKRLARPKNIKCES